MKGYKTMIVNGAAVLVPVLDTVLNHGELVGAVLGPNAVVALSILGVVNMGLRWITSTPVFKKE